MHSDPHAAAVIDVLDDLGFFYYYDEDVEHTGFKSRTSGEFLAAYFDDRGIVIPRFELDKNFRITYEECITAEAMASVFKWVYKRITRREM